MIVEDTPDLREFLVKNFEDIYDVLSAKNGAEALAILEKQACDLIISDALMPEMDGFDLLMKVRNDEMLVPHPVHPTLGDRLRGLEDQGTGIRGRRLYRKTLFAKLRQGDGGESAREPENGLSATLRRGRIFSMKKMTWGAMTGNG